MADYKVNKPYSPSWNGVRSKYETVPDLTKPLPPRNIFVTTPYVTGILDIRWDNPLESPENSKWEILGVNVYRSEDSEGGPFHVINTSPVKILYYRDQTTHRLVADEDVMPRLSAGTNPRAEWVVKTLHTPLIKQGSQNVLVEDPIDVVVRIDNGDGKGLLGVPAYRVNARTGEIFLITKSFFNPETKKIEEARLPKPPSGRCTVSYCYNTNFVKTDLVPRLFYKITTVGKDPKTGLVFETHIDNVKAVNVYDIEKPHYVWKAIISKNRYLLEQMGERVKVFMRREVGDRCPNYTDTHAQASNSCPLCYGTGILGGYDGPVDITIAPPEAEKHINLTDTGLKLNFTYDSWTGPSPLLRTRDFVVRQNGERLMVGSVTPQGAKGAVFQQHFTLNYRDSKDIIYQVPMDPSSSTPLLGVPVSDDTRGINQPITNSSPVIPEHKDNVPNASKDKGRTIDYENVVW